MRLGPVMAMLALPGAGLALDGAGLTPFGRQASPPDLVRSAASFDCAEVSCKQLSSCDEACFKLVQCGQSKRDGDNDGIPCENLCSRPCPR